MHDRGDSVKLSTGKILVEGKLADPEKVTLTIIAPSGEEETRTYPPEEEAEEEGEIVRESEGLYYSYLDLTETGSWEWRWEGVGGAQLAEPGNLYVTSDGFNGEPGGAHIVDLADFRPSVRRDGLPWTEARIDESDDPAGKKWTTPEGEEEEPTTYPLDPLDEDPEAPMLRSLTASVSQRWVRVVFLDAEGAEDNPSPIVATSGAQFRPTVKEVSAILRARTYTDSSEEIGEFSPSTRPTAEEVEDDLIPAACADVSLRLGRVPGEFLDSARRVAALRTASDIERSHLPEQSELGAAIYQTLRYTFEEEIDKLCRNLQWWALNEGIAKELLA
jgi:hypothetical protein